MNLPVGEVVSRGINLKEIDVKKLIESFFEKELSGYLVNASEGEYGIEEGIMLFKDGVFVASFYEYNFYGVTVFGDVAVQHVFNSFVADYVVGDIVSLSNQQVDLVTAFNDKSKLTKQIKKGDVGRLIPSKFSTKFAESVLKEVAKEKDSKTDIFKKLGLSGLGG